MNIKKKILAISIGPVLVLGIISLAFSVTMVKNSMLDEVKDALKGTAEWMSPFFTGIKES